MDKRCITLSNTARDDQTAIESDQTPETKSFSAPPQGEDSQTQDGPQANSSSASDDKTSADDSAAMAHLFDKLEQIEFAFVESREASDDVLVRLGTVLEQVLTERAETLATDARSEAQDQTSVPCRNGFAH